MEQQLFPSGDDSSMNSHLPPQGEPGELSKGKWISVFAQLIRHPVQGCTEQDCQITGSTANIAEQAPELHHAMLYLHGGQQSTLANAADKSMLLHCHNALCISI